MIIRCLVNFGDPGESAIQLHVSNRVKWRNQVSILWRGKSLLGILFDFCQLFTVQRLARKSGQLANESTNDEQYAFSMRSGASVTDARTHAVKSCLKYRREPEAATQRKHAGQTDRRTDTHTHTSH